MSTNRKEPREGPLWFITIAFAAIIIMGALASQDKAAAQMLAVLGALAIPLLCMLHRMVNPHE